MVVDTHLYDILGVSPDVSERDLKKAFMLKARETHPDKHKDDPEATEKFQQVNEAYEILKDPQKRELYDKYGVDGLREGAGQEASFNDILAHLFNFPTANSNQRPRTRDIIEEVHCTLAELYNGTEKTIKVKRHVVCPKCNGNGTKDGTPAKKCEKCKGQGQVMVTIQEGNSYYQTITKCPDCQGMGEHIDPENQCKQCKGEHVVEEEKDIELHIERGAEDGQKMVFKGASDEIPEADAGDLIVIIREEPDEVFTRNHADLLVHHKICLSESLFGARFPITHLDGRVLVIETNPKEVIEPNSVQRVENEGMPVRNDTFKKGSLYIEYEVVFPKRDELTHEFRHALCKVIPHKDMAKDVDVKSENVHVYTPKDSTLEEFENAKRAKSEKRQEAYNSENDDDDDYEDEDGQQGAGCQPM